MLKKTYRLRLLLLGFLSLLMFGAIEARLYYLQVVRYDAYATRAHHQQNKSVMLIPRRGDILDRKGVALATSHLTDTIILDTRKPLKRPEKKKPTKHHDEDEEKEAEKAAKEPPQKQKPDPQMVRELAELLLKPEAQVWAYFDKPRRHVLLRKAPDEVSQAIALIEERYKIAPGVFIFEKDSKREYPNGSLASHILGFTKIDDNGDNIGQAGVELVYDKWLKGAYTKQEVLVSSAQKRLAPLADEAIAATMGSNVVLTIDREIQMFAERALRRKVGEANAKGGIVAVMDVPSGEILAMASCPDFDLNSFTKADPLQLRNRLLSDPIQIGSVMKILTTALLLDQGLLRTDEPIDCQGGRGYVDGRRMTDSHALGVVPFSHAFAESSNIGLATVGLRLEPNNYYDGLTRFGMGKKSGIDLPGEEEGLLRTVDKWSRLSRTSLPIGYESLMTGVQVISALSAIGNGGQRMRPHIVREVRAPNGAVLLRNEPKLADQVASPETCKTVLELMENVVVEGTGDKAKIPGYRIGGKTGTSVKSRPGETPKRYYASFAGLLPAQKPRLAIYVYVDEPQGVFYGGTVAAPIFQEIALYAAHILGIPPDDPVEYEKAQAEVDRSFAAVFGTAVTSDTLQTSATTSRAAGGEEEDLDAEEPAEAQDGTTPTPTPELDDGRPRVPSFQGMTIVEAWDALARTGLKGKVLGSGMVTSQEPAAGSVITSTTTVSIILTTPIKATKTVGASPPVQAK